MSAASFAFLTAAASTSSPFSLIGLVGYAASMAACFSANAALTSARAADVITPAAIAAESTVNFLMISLFWLRRRNCIAAAILHPTGTSSTKLVPATPRDACDDQPCTKKGKQNHIVLHNVIFCYLRA
jgi:hypothetical protein